MKHSNIVLNHSNVVFCNTDLLELHSQMICHLKALIFYGSVCFTAACTLPCTPAQTFLLYIAFESIDLQNAWTPQFLNIYQKTLQQFESNYLEKTKEYDRLLLKGQTSTCKNSRDSKILEHLLHRRFGKIIYDSLSELGGRGKSTKVTRANFLIL